MSQQDLAIHRRNFSRGFFLDELELRRLYGDLRKEFDGECIKHSAGGGTINNRIIIEFAGGTRVKVESLDELIGYENSGRTEIISLIFASEQLRDTNGSDNVINSVSVEFRNVDHELNQKGGNPPIKISVVGVERNWVFHTVSVLEDRLRKAQGTVLVGWMRRMFGIALTVPLFGLCGFMILPPSDRKEQIDQIEVQYQTGQIEDVGELVIALERIVNARAASADSMWVGMMILMLVLVFLPYAVERSLRWSYPPFNFYWGDSINAYKRKKTVRWFIFCGVILSAAVNVFSSYLWELIRR